MDQFLAEIRVFACNFAPKGWAFCSGQILPIAQNTALFSLIGTYYGGNGTSNFALPNLQGNAALSMGNGPGLSPYVLGESLGNETIKLGVNEGAIHNHAVNCFTDDGSAPGPGANVLSSSGADRGLNVYNDASTGTTASMNPAMISPNGVGVPHNNMSPYLALNYCIALVGIYPPRS